MESPGPTKVERRRRKSLKRDRFEEEEEEDEACQWPWNTIPSSSSSKPGSLWGPLVFNPISASKSSLLSSPSLLPPVASAAAAAFRNNRLQSLRCPAANSFILFFPTGNNSDRVGFLVLSVRTSGLVVDNGAVFSAACGLSHQILRISVSPAVAKGGDVIGYLSASTMYSVDWFVVRAGADAGAQPSLVRAGGKVFRSCGVVRASWSPHLPEECVVLLESGELFLFDLEPWLDPGNSDPSRKGTRLRVPWDRAGSPDLPPTWVSCEFGWHPRILVLARSDAVFVADLRPGECSVSCLMRIETLRGYSPVENERFLSFARAGFDGFRFVLVSSSLLVLCDVRKPLIPLLQWVHGLADPCYVDVFRLADLRSNSSSDVYKKASESGFCIVLGSFWSSRFNLFCYGPSSLAAQSGKLLPRGSGFSKSLCAWDRHSDLLLSGCECRCGSCLVKEEFSKEEVPLWLEWQYKKELVLGFSIVDKDLSTLLSNPDEFGGFTLVRLMSSGRLESQRYSASWGRTLKKIEESHNKATRFDDYLMCYAPDYEYRFPRKFSYLKLSCLNGHLDFKLGKVLDSKLKTRETSPRAAAESFTPGSHEILCEKLSACGLSRARTSPVTSVVFKDVDSPSTLHEVALRRMWAGLPVELLQLAFSHYSELLDPPVDPSLEFLAVPDRPRQLPPFVHRNPSRRGNRWYRRVQRSDDALVGPVLPLPVLLELHEFHYGSPAPKEESGGFSVEAEHRLRCDEVVNIASETAAREPVDGFAVSLADDREELWAGSQAVKPLVMHKPLAFSHAADDHKEEEVFGTLISRVAEKGNKGGSNGNVVVELFDSLCPVKLSFDDTSSAVDFGAKELKAYRLLKRQFGKWQKGFQLYQEFCTKSKFKS